MNKMTATARISDSMEVWFIAPDGSFQDAFWYENRPWNQFMLAPSGSAAESGIRSISRIPQSIEIWWIGPQGSVEGAFWYENGQWSRYPLIRAKTFSGNITSGGLAALGGWVDVTVSGDGRTRWRGHAHDSGADGYEFGITAILRSTGGRALAFTHQGHVGGTFTSGPPPETGLSSPIRLALVRMGAEPSPSRASMGRSLSTWGRQRSTTQGITRGRVAMMAASAVGHSSTSWSMPAKSIMPQWTCLSSPMRLLAKFAREVVETPTSMALLALTTETSISNNRHKSSATGSSDRTASLALTRLVRRGMRTALTSATSSVTSVQDVFNRPLRATRCSLR
jgi:hypothetical protein